MAHIHLVRHGKAAAGFGSHKDPGLDDLGRQQAEAVAAMLDARHGTQRPILFSSPLAVRLRRLNPWLRAGSAKSPLRTALPNSVAHRRLGRARSMVTTRHAR